jgi:site-specific DNA-methyltransferase (adenine-specific)
MTSRVLFTSKRDVWSTPQSLFDRLNAEFGFTIDVCATEENARVRPYYSPEVNGLKQQWKGTVWMNPPFSEIERWMKKAYLSSLLGATVVALTPARVDTKWFFDFALRAEEIRFLQGRLRFGDARNSAPFPTCIAVFRPGYHGEPKIVFVPKNAH